jgi:hypothetical protein
MDAAKSGRELRDRDGGAAGGGKAAVGGRKRKAVDAPAAPIKAEPESPAEEVRARPCARGWLLAAPGHSVWFSDARYHLRAAPRAAASSRLPVFAQPLSALTPALSPLSGGAAGEDDG